MNHMSKDNPTTPKANPKGQVMVDIENGNLPPFKDEQEGKPFMISAPHVVDMEPMKEVAADSAGGNTSGGGHATAATTPPPTNSDNGKKQAGAATANRDDGRHEMVRVRGMRTQPRRPRIPYIRSFWIWLTRKNTSDFLSMKFPNGVCNLQAYLSLTLTLQGIFTLFAPFLLSKFGLKGVDLAEFGGVSRFYYGISMLLLAFYMWYYTESPHKRSVRLMMFVMTVNFTILCLIDLFNLAYNVVQENRIYRAKNFIMMPMLGMRIGTLLTLSFFYSVEIDKAASTVVIMSPQHPYLIFPV